MDRLNPPSQFENESRRHGPNKPDDYTLTVSSPMRNSSLDTSKNTVSLTNKGKNCSNRPWIGLAFRQEPTVAFFALHEPLPIWQTQNTWSHPTSLRLFNTGAWIVFFRYRLGAKQNRRHPH